MAKLGRFIACVFFFIVFLGTMSFWPLYAYIMTYGPEWVKRADGACIGVPLVFIGSAINMILIVGLCKVFPAKDSRHGI